MWQRLADRAAAIGRPVPQRVTTTDADLRLLTNQAPAKPVFSDSDRVTFVLPRGATRVRLLSCAQSPAEARPWLDDRRRLGVYVARIVLRARAMCARSRWITLISRTAGGPSGDSHLRIP